MTEIRTWEQMKRDNVGAAWIDENGNFCSNYTRNMMRYVSHFDKCPVAQQVEHFSAQSNLPGWKQDGFNGCWSCEASRTCESYQTKFKTEDRS